MPTTSSGSLVFPVLLWDKNPPECQISSILINENENYILTGTTSGHIIIWDFTVNEITPKWLMIGHTNEVNCLSKAGFTKEEEYIVSSSKNGEMKLWELNEKKCIESIKMPNTVHKKIYSSKLNGKYYRLFCIGNYIDVLVIDPISLDILYTLVSREQHECIRALCINSLTNHQDDVIVGVSITGIIKLWTLSANEIKGSEIVEHEYKKSLCENAITLSSCPGKQRIFIIVCPKFFQIFDAVDFTVLSQVNIKSLYNNDDSVNFINGFFVDITQVIVATSNGQAYLYQLPENINPSSNSFRKYSSLMSNEKYFKVNLVYKFLSREKEVASVNKIRSEAYCLPIFYLYESKKKVLNVKNENESDRSEQNRFLIKADSIAQLSVWNLERKYEYTKFDDYRTSLDNFWKENFQTLRNDFGTISTLLYIPKINKLIYGMSDGTIIMRPAIEFLIETFFSHDSNNIGDIIKLKKHTDKVTCILYPHSEHPRYDSSFLVTGSLDFSIILWNIYTAEMIHRFVVQTGEILQISVPPNNVNPRILQCICSIASDHSVALLSLKECKPIMIASRHLFPVLFIRWRPLDDYLIVKCSDGGVFVWQIETGNLDRIAHGLTAEDILNAADEIIINPDAYSQNSPTSNVFISNQTSSNVGSSLTNITHISHSTPMIVSNKLTSNQTISLAHILQKRSFSNAIKTISQKLASTKEDPKINLPLIDSSFINFPLIIHPFHLNSNDTVKHLLLFDIDNLLTTLALEEYSIEATVEQIKNNFFREVHNVGSASSKQLILPSQRIQSPKPLKRNASAKIFESIDSKQLDMFKSKLSYSQYIVNLAHLLLSSLHIWTLDESIDNSCDKILNLKKPIYPVSFGRISRGAHFFIMFPPKRYNSEKNEALEKKNDFSELKNSLLSNSKSFNLIDLESEEGSDSNSESSKTDALIISKTKRREISNFKFIQPSKEYWLSIKSITTEQILAILAICDSLMNTRFITYLNINKNFDPLEIIFHERETNDSNEIQNNFREAYSHISSIYYMLSEYSNESKRLIKHLNLEILALKWMDPSYQIREAAQTLLKNELKKLGFNGRANLIKHWEPHLINFLREFDEKNPSHNQNYEIQPSESTTSSSEINKADSSNINEVNLPLNSNRIRRKQFVAIIILSVIGAEFGQDINDKRNQSQLKTIPKGFSLEDHTILKRISNVLSNLVTNKMLQYDITRRASIDLIGRGFSKWEPFIQPSSILITLLELTADSKLYLPRININLPLTANGDLCKIAMNSLNIIANSKPESFILTITKEIKRINATPLLSQANNTQINSSLLRSRQEIIKIVDRLVENQSQVTYELITDIIEIIIFCFDSNQVRNIQLDELFPSLFKYPMVRFCRESRRIICGCINGRLVTYELKAGKWNTQTFHGHNGQPIVAIAISFDSKYIASYSAHDNTLIFWQCSGGNIFNIGSNVVKQIKKCNAAPLDLNVPSIKLANLFFQNKTVNLIYHDSRKFSYQI